MTIIDIPHHRLYNQHIARQTLKKPAEVVAWMGAMQAQDYTGAKWSVGLRLPKATDAEVEQAIADKTIIRTWPMRGTLHFVAAADVRWMLALLASRTIAASARRYKELELDAETLIRSNDLLLKALEGGQQRSRTDLLEMLEANGISTTGQRAAYMLQRASLDGLICQGVTKGSVPMYMALDESLPKTKPLETDAALAELAARYFQSHGPTTVQDLVRWAGITLGQARTGLDGAQSKLVEEKIDGQSYWLPASADVPTKCTSSLFLLPGFDEYLLGYGDRGAVLDPQHADKIVPGGNGVFRSTIVSDGQVVGLWKREVKKGRVNISVEPFDSLTDAQGAAAADAANRYGAFIEKPVTVAQAN
ncbi:MAG: winged helix DNA-binding domain-containing protein [Anaerolineae bacterium]|nr:winged helix DNA-binding domain-containing protein [Anaerolineae bacterium]